MLINNGTLTIYSPYYEGTTLKYKRINIPRANIRSKRNATVGDKKINVFYTTFIVVDSEYKVKTNDKIVLESLFEDISEIKELQDYDVLTVVGVQRNTMFNSITIEAK